MNSNKSRRSAGPPIRCIDPDCETRVHWLRPHSCKESKERGFYESPMPMKPEFQALIARGNVTSNEIEKLRGNSWDWFAIMPVLDSYAFMRQLKYCLSHCNKPSARPAHIYDEAVLHEWLPELINRFERLESLMNSDLEAMVTYEKE